MKIREMSDLHLEFGGLKLDKNEADVLVLAGDIGVSRSAGLWALTQAQKFQIPVVMVAGNHEFYKGWDGHDMEQVYADLRAIGNGDDGFYFLQNETVEIDNVRFIGATLWTDFNLYGRPEIDMGNAQVRMNDYSRITLRPMTKWMPYDALQSHMISRVFLADEFAKNYNGKTVVVTHHGVSQKSIHDKYVGDDLNASYVSNLDEFVSNSKASIWFHGHIHYSFDYMLGNTRVFTNPRGYKNVEENILFNPNVIVEI